MNRYLKQLIEIAAIDKEIDSFEPRIAEVKAGVIQLIEQRSELESAISTLQEEEKDISLKISKNDAHLAELKKKSEDIAKKWKIVKTEKENKALSLEEEILKEQVTFANEEIERLGKNQASKKEEIKKLSENVKKIEAEEKSVEEGLKVALEDIQKQREIVFQKKESLVRDMDQKLIYFYEKIKKWAKNTSVVYVYKQACGGCFIRLNDKTYADILKGEDIITCPHCGRILYAKSETQEQEDAQTKVS